MEVLELLDDLATMGRRATPEEQAVLASWSGWGATPAIFDEADADTAEARGRVQELMSEEDWAAARRTVLNAHYTDPMVAAAMWAALSDLGFAGGRVLEPGCGSGNLIAYATPGARMTGVERDPATASVARALYPDAEIHSCPFEQFAPPDPFDAVIANVPFAEPRAFG
jgi:SAM-dependent methyltransferase